MKMNHAFVVVAVLSLVFALCLSSVTLAADQIQQRSRDQSCEDGICDCICEGDICHCYCYCCDEELVDEVSLVILSDQEQLRDRNYLEIPAHDGEPDRIKSRDRDYMSIA